MESIAFAGVASRFKKLVAANDTPAVLTGDRFNLTIDWLPVDITARVVDFPQICPYIGFTYTDNYGETAGFAREDDNALSCWRCFVFGVWVWR